MSIYNVLEELKNTSSRNDKIEILKSLSGKEKEFFQKIAFLTYDPSIDFYIREFDKPTHHLNCITLNESVRDLENILAQRMITGNKAKSWVESQAEMLSEDDFEVFNCIIKRDLRCGVSAKTINKVWPGTIYEHPYMRCSSFNEKNLKNVSYPCISQTKMDGLYCDIMVFGDRVEYRSRNGSYLRFNNEEFDQELIDCSPNTVLMGEALAVDENGELMGRADSNGYLNSNDIDIERVNFFLWDCVTMEDFEKKKSNHPYSKRIASCEAAVVFMDSPRLHMVDTVICEDQDDIINHFRAMREAGEEGTVIKDKKGIWKDGTSKDQVKVKVVFECELKAVGYKEGTGKNVGKLGAITFQSDDGTLEVSVGTGYKDVDRESFWEEIDDILAEGRIATIRANDISQNEGREGVYSLFLPRFVEWRTDKSNADSTDRIMEQIKSFTDALKMIR